jgi:hypothetical protein
MRNIHTPRYILLFGLAAQIPFYLLPSLISFFVQNFAAIKAFFEYRGAPSGLKLLTEKFVTLGEMPENF